MAKNPENTGTLLLGSKENQPIEIFFDQIAVMQKPPFRKEYTTIIDMTYISGVWQPILQ